MENNIVKSEEYLELDTVEGRIEASNKMNSGSFESLMQKVASKFTPEYLEQLSKDAYKEDREYPENFSNWFYHIKDFGNFEHANVIANQVFTYEETEIMRKTDDMSKVNWGEINNILKPTLDKLENYKVYNIKNGCFSNKFEFNTSLATKQDLAQQLWEVNYQSSIFETGGYTELVVRELIPFNLYETPTIYNGMPLREEVRVFYNLDKKRIEYIVDYWNYKYCRPNIRSKSDQLVFDWFHNKLKTRKLQHREKLQELETRIWDNIHTLKFDDELHGVWSIDFMWVEETDKLYLIDMARGCRSAYWNIDKLSYTTRMELKEKINGR